MRVPAEHAMYSCCMWTRKQGQREYNAAADSPPQHKNLCRVGSGSDSRQRWHTRLGHTEGLLVFGTAIQRCPGIRKIKVRLNRQIGRPAHQICVRIHNCYHKSIAVSEQ